MLRVEREAIECFTCTVMTREGAYKALEVWIELRPELMNLSRISASLLQRRTALLLVAPYGGLVRGFELDHGQTAQGRVHCQQVDLVARGETPFLVDEESVGPRQRADGR